MPWTLMQAILIALRSENPIDHALGIFDPSEQLFRATALLQSGQTIGADLPMLVDVGHSTHQWTENDFGVILKEVDLDTNERTVEKRGTGEDRANLQSAIGQVENDRVACAKPRFDERKSREFISWSRSMRSTGLEGVKIRSVSEQNSSLTFSKCSSM